MVGGGVYLMQTSFISSGSLDETMEKRARGLKVQCVQYALLQVTQRSDCCQQGRCLNSSHLLHPH